MFSIISDPILSAVGYPDKFKKLAWHQNYGYMTYDEYLHIMYGLPKAEHFCVSIPTVGILDFYPAYRLHASNGTFLVDGFPSRMNTLIR